MAGLSVTVGAGAAAAAAGLGLAAAGAVTLGALARGLRGGGGRRQGGRRGGGRRGGRRRGRSISEETQELDNALDVIRLQDFRGCGLRLMCELAGDNPEDLNEEGLAILDLVGPVARPGEGFLPPGGRGDFMEAKSLGHTSGFDCGQFYSFCPLNSTQLMNTVMAALQ